MTMKFKYEIISVDTAARCMEVKYTAEGHAAMHISARIPFADEDLESVVRTYAPTQIWEDSVKSVVPPTVGQTGEVEPIIQEIYDGTGFVEQTTI